MPGFDGTGPRGMGPMTGGGRGYCNPAGYRPRRGFAQGFRAFGRPWGAGYASPGYYQGAPYGAGMTREQEVDFLRDQANLLKNQLQEIESRVAQLGKSEK